MRPVGVVLFLIALAATPLCAGGYSTERDRDQEVRRRGEEITSVIGEEEYQRLRDAHIARLRGVEPGKPFDPTNRIRAIRQMERQEALWRGMVSASKFGVVPLAFPTWVELGPNPIPNGQTTPPNPVSGRVTAIEIDPTNANIVYVGAAQGGVYRSLDGGATWTPIFDSAQSLAIGALALDAANERLYVGTGEANNAIDSYSGVGLYRIDNVNTNPVLVGPINPVRNYTDSIGPESVPVFNGATIARIVIVPNDPTKLFVGTNFSGAIGIGDDFAFGGNIPPHAIPGLFRLNFVTGDPAAVTVAKIKVSTAIFPAGCFDIPCTGTHNVDDMVFDPGDPTGNTLLVWQNGTSGAGGGGGVWRSTDAMGVNPTFTKTFATTAGVIRNGRGALAIYKEGANPAVVYAASGEPATGTTCGTGNGALRVSTDGGVTFGNGVMAGAKLAGGGGFCFDQCTYNIAFAVNPGPTTGRTDDVLYLGGIDNTGCSLWAAKSTDGGATFVESNLGVHVDAHVVRIAPSNPSILYRGDDGGIWKSINAGVDWASLNNTTFRATQFQSIAVHPIDQNFSIGGVQDNGTNHLLSNGTWNRIDYGDGGFALIDQNATDTTSVVMYHTFYNLPNSLIGYSRVDTVAAATEGNWFFSGCVDGVTPANGITCGDVPVFYAPMALGPGGTGNPNTVYYGTDHVYRSADKGVNNTVVSQAPLVSGQSISDIAISPQDDNYRIVGVTNGALFFTTTGLTTLAVLDPIGVTGVIPDNYVARIVFDPADKNTAYIAIGGYMGDTASAHSHVWKITNLNTTPVRTAINGSGLTGLPDVPVNGFAIDPMQTTRLFAGTDIGVYDSEDGGLTWSPFGLGLPRVAVFDMAVQNVKRVLRIATHGRGMWEIGLNVPGTVIVNPPSGVTAAATSTSSVLVSWSPPAGTAVNYLVWRSTTLNGAYTQVGTSMGTSFVDSGVGVLANTTYIYKVKSVDGSSNISPFSNMDFATTVMFADDPIVAGTTAVKAVHLTQLRTAVNAMQLAAGQTATTFTDATVDNTLVIKGIHVDQLRTALNGGRMMLGVPQLLFTNPTLMSGATVKAIDFQEIRDGVK